MRPEAPPRLLRQFIEECRGIHVRILKEGKRKNMEDAVKFIFALAVWIRDTQRSGKYHALFQDYLLPLQSFVQKAQLKRCLQKLCKTQKALLVCLQDPHMRHHLSDVYG